jgi:hypothetical protein
MHVQQNIHSTSAAERDDSIKKLEPIIYNHIILVKQLEIERDSHAVESQLLQVRDGLLVHIIQSPLIFKFLGLIVSSQCR